MDRISRETFNNVGSLALALFLAIIIWVIAVTTDNPLVVRRDFPAGGLRVNFQNLDPSLVIVNDGERGVSLDIRAPSESWAQLEPSDLVASADLVGLGPGVHQVEVNVTQVPPADPNVRILRRSPDRLTIELDQTITRTVPIQVEVADRNSVPSSYQIITPTVVPGSVEVFGPSALLEKIERAVVNVEVRGSRATIETERPIQLVDTTGELIAISQIPTLRLSPDEAAVQVPIQQRQGYRELIVSPVIQGEPDRGYWLSDLRVDPATVTVVGLPTQIEALPSIVRTEPIDITGTQAGTLIRSTRLALPENVSPVNQRVVSVTLGIEPWLSGTTIALAPEPTGLRPGLAIESISPEKLDILVEGPQVELESLTPEQVVATLNLGGLGIGTHLLTPSVRTPGSLAAKSWLPEQVEVTLAEARAQEIITKTVGVSGLPGNLRAIVSPPTLTLAYEGPVLVLQTLTPESITATVSLPERRSGSYVLTPTLNIPPGITLTQITPSELTVDVFSPNNTLIVTRTLAWDNLASGLVLNLNPRQITIQVRGPGQTNALQTNPLVRASVDVRDLGVGAYTLQPQISLPNGYELLAISPANIDARLSRE